MKKIIVVLAVLCVLAMPVFAQTARNSVNAALDSWTVDGAENGMKENVSNVVIQRTNNQMQYYLQVRGGDAITYDFDRVTKRLRISVKKQLQLSTELTFTESGSTSSITYTDKDGKVNALHFTRK
jgi:Tfp pilus assembly protein FimT